MKKTYIFPNMLVVRLSANRPIMVVGSLTTDGATFYDTNATGDAMVKESSVNDVNLWDNEW